MNVDVELIDRHLTANVYDTHDPFPVEILLLLYTNVCKAASEITFDLYGSTNIYTHFKKVVCSLKDIFLFLCFAQFKAEYNKCAVVVYLLG